MAGIATTPYPSHLSARDALVKKLRDYQDYSGVRVVVVFDGKGTSTTEQSESHSIQVFYSRAGQTADAIIERLAGKYAEKFDLTVATADLRERETATAFGAECISIANLRAMIDEAVSDQAAPSNSLCRRRRRAL